MRQSVLCEQADPTGGNSRSARSAALHLIGELVAQNSFDLGVISEPYSTNQATANWQAAAPQLPWSVTCVSILLFRWFGQFSFHTQQSQKKVDPNFADRFGQCGRPLRRALFNAETETDAQGTKSCSKHISRTASTSERAKSESTILPSLYALPIYDFDVRASHARTLLPAALASVSFGYVLIRVQVREAKASVSARNC